MAGVMDGVSRYRFPYLGVSIWVLIVVMLGSTISVNGQYNVTCLDDTVVTIPDATSINIPDADLQQYYILYTDGSIMVNITLIPLVDNYNFLPGPNTVMVYTDTDTNQTECNITITVIVPTEPKCPDDLTIGNDPDAVTAVVSWTDQGNNYTDILPLSSSIENGTTLPFGEQLVTIWRTNYTELNCTFIITVQDEQEPEYTIVPADDLVTAGNSDTVTWVVEASDNTGVITLTSSHNPGDYFPIGNTTVTYSATDRNGLVTNITFTVMVVDDGSPYINMCPGDQLIEIPAGTDSTTATWTEPTVDETEPVEWTSDYASGDSFSLGTTLVTYTATFENDAENSSSCFFKIMVTEMADTAPPTGQCPGDVTQNVAPGTQQVEITWVEPTFEDVHIIQKSKEPGSNFSAGTTQVLYTIFDENYNPKTCTFSVTVNVAEDTDAPVFTDCPSNFTHWVIAGTTTTEVTWTPPNVTDNYPDFTLVASDSPGDTFDVGADYLITYTATDVVGNTGVCSFAISVMVDTEDPIVICPDDIVQYVPQGQASTVAVEWPVPVAWDNSGNDTITVTSSPESGHEFPASLSGPAGTVLVTASDPYGNEITCTFTVTVTIDTAPVFSCDDVDVVVETLPGETYADVTWPGVTVTDDFTPVAELNYTSSHTQPLRLNYNDDAVDVSLTATDENGNIGMCVFSVSVEDNEDPVWMNCSGNITEPADPGTNSAQVSWTAPTVSDNSGDATITSMPAEIEQHFSGGTWPVTYIATDPSNNEGVCVFYVTVTVDADVPIFDNCPDDSSYPTETGTDSATVTWPTITATDIDGDVTITSNYVSPVELSIGSYEVVYQAVDTSGNIAYCRWTISIFDNENPAFQTCPDDVEVFVHQSTQSVIVTWPIPTATDNSGAVTISLSAGSPSGSRFTQGTYDIAYVATDAGGQAVAPCEFTVTVAAKPSADIIEIEGELLLDVVRGLNGVFTDTTRIANLESDLDDYFRHSTAMSADFVGIDITSSGFDTDGNLLIQYDLYLCDPAYYNEEEIKEAFAAALTDSNSFPTANTVVANTFNLHEKEFRGLFTLASIVDAKALPVIFSDCCSSPTSNDYLELQERIHKHLHRTYSSMSLFQMVRALRFRSGSVVVPYTVTFHDDTTVTNALVESTFISTVTSNQELVANAVSTDLYLEVQQPYVTTEEICPASYCTNGGTCVVTNATFIYDFGCSCPTGYTGERCETELNTTVDLSIEAIIGIVLGLLALLLLLMLLCCCCLLCWPGARDRKRPRRDPEYGPSPIVLVPMPREREYVPERPAIKDRPGPIITEVPEGRDGPSFYHGDQHMMVEEPPKRHMTPPPYLEPPPPRPSHYLVAPPPRPAHYVVPPPPRPVPPGPSFLHEYEDRIQPVAHRHEHYREPQRQTQRQPSRRSRLRAFLPERLPLFGPHFRGNDRPDRAAEMKRQLFEDFNY